MARISLLSNLTLLSADVFPAPLDAKATNDRWKHKVLVFNNNGSVRISLHGSVSIPENYSSTPALIVKWSSPTTTNNVVWDFDYRVVSGDDTESLDQTSQDESVSITDAAPSAAWEQMEPSVSLTGSNFAAGAFLQYEFARDKSDASDTLADIAVLFDLLLDYTET